MKFGIREICDVVLKAKAAQKIGNKIFYANEPVLYFDTLKSSSMEGASTTVYAQGGRGNTRLVAWEGERTVTFTMEDALISPEGFMILTGAGLIESGDETPIYQHMTETVDKSSVFDVVSAKTYDFSFDLVKTGSGKAGDLYKYSINHKYFTYAENETEPKKETSLTITADGKYIFGDDATAELVEDAKGNLVAQITASVDQFVIPLEHAPYLPVDANGDYAYVMMVDKGEIVSEPIIPEHKNNNTDKYVVIKSTHENYNAAIPATGSRPTDGYKLITEDMASWKADFDSVIVDYYVEHKKAGAAKQIEISAESFGGNFYLEASTLFRDTNGSDLPAEFIIPNCKIQSNFNFSMASSGDPSTFTFTMDAFPDYTRFDRSKKVLAAIQILGADEKASMYRESTLHGSNHDELLKSL